MTPRAREILSWYGADNVGTLTNLARLLNHGRLAGTGKLVILPVDQGFEHGPARSFAPNPPAYNPRYHLDLAIEAGCNAYAAPLGFLEAGARDFAGEIPLILKTNDNDVLREEEDPNQALTASVQDALRLGCCAVGFTIYPGSAHQLEMYGQFRAYAEEAKRNGLARRIVIFSGGAAVFDDDKFLDEIRAIHAGGGFGSIIGRNSFQRPKEDALRMLGAVMDIYASPAASAGTC
ncbi:MAG: fructose-bisphosphate aldolase [Xanthobacteraceae bacterium]|jgi:class I fructose-bisphosphate aldolase